MMGLKRKDATVAPDKQESPSPEVQELQVKQRQIERRVRFIEVKLGILVEPGNGKEHHVAG